MKRLRKIFLNRVAAALLIALAGGLAVRHHDYAVAEICAAGWVTSLAVWRAKPHVTA